MKIPIIKIADKEKEQSFILSDLTPFSAKIENNGTLEFIESLKSENCAYELKEDSIQFVSISKILELFMKEEVEWLHSKKLNKEGCEIIDLFKKFENNLYMSISEKRQNTLSEYFETVGIPIQYSDSDFIEIHDIMTEEEWQQATKIAYATAKEIKTNELSSTEIKNYLQKYCEPTPTVIDICHIYYKYVDGTTTLDVAKDSLNKIKRLVVVSNE